MNLPFFYTPEYNPLQEPFVLGEETSKHIIQVLRMKKGEALTLADGKGNLMSAEIIDDHKKRCGVRITGTQFIPADPRRITIAISLLKNSNRFEWFLEKVTEIGVQEIIPLICERTEKQKFREERMQNILISAMLQSKQPWLPVLHSPLVYEMIFSKEEIMHTSQKFVAHCMEDQKRKLADLVNESLPSQIILIGPEGDLTAQEVQLAVENHFDGVSLGDTILRTETAGIVAATILRLG